MPPEHTIAGLEQTIGASGKHAQQCQIKSAITELQQLQRRIDGQRRVLDRIASGTPFYDTLQEIEWGTAP